jgi:hypothetical protein
MEAEQKVCAVPLTAFGFDIGEPFLYQYNLLVPWGLERQVGQE